VSVDIAADGGDWGESAERIEDGGVADISGVEDVVRGGECGECFRPQETVGVADDAENSGDFLRVV
jgi:hypothetical protein